MEKKYKMIAFLGFALYFITGAACFVVGSSLPHLVKLYDMELNQVVLLGSAYALGRVLTVRGTGRLVETLGPVKVLGVGVLFIAAFLLGIPVTANYYAGLFFAFLGGVGMGSQDTVCPVFLSAAFKDNYASALSAGQALFGLGAFATPFLVGLMLTAGLPFYYSYYVLLLVPVAMILCLPFVKWEKKEQKKGEEELVKPLYAKNKLVAYGSVILITAAYSAAVSTIGLYTSSFAESMGITQAASAFMLTVYNVGCVAGSVAFIFILRKISVQWVLIGNSLIAMLAVALAMFVNQTGFYFAALAVAGFFIGVLFSVIVAIATRIGYKRISVSGSLVATAGGASDILTPIVTGFLVGILGIGCSFYYVIIMLAICIAAAAVLKISTTEERGRKENGSSE